MAHLIDKDALVAEIKEKRDRIKKGIFSIPLTGRDRAYATFEYEILGKIEEFLDTLEVKEADLIIHTIIAESCDWLALHAKLNNEQIECYRNLMLNIKDEQIKAQKGDK